MLMLRTHRSRHATASPSGPEELTNTVGSATWTLGAPQQPLGSLPALVLTNHHARMDAYGSEPDRELLAHGQGAAWIPVCLR